MADALALATPFEGQCERMPMSQEQPTPELTGPTELVVVPGTRAPRLSAGPDALAKPGLETGGLVTGLDSGILQIPIGCQVANFHGRDSRFLLRRRVEPGTAQPIGVSGVV